MITHHQVCEVCGDVMANGFYGYEGPEDHVCVTLSDSRTVFEGLDSLLARWLPFSDYMARRRLAI